MARGRPPRDDNEIAAKHVIGVRFTDDELEKLDQAAAAEYQTRAGWIRRVTLEATERVLGAKRRR